ncbi:hypothetical protein AN218_29620 [Streptomyces nanshensis]|uniref:THIF-type NAD/FAD binding fold domain-containing protein n=1 Tax=Streptomyces nanshensis TaxID=518642 RepID=A0A1E7KTA1_9ACTN|nr:hypothetical protein AN218_29620 [Streptomyces nanshensis]
MKPALAPYRTADGDVRLGGLYGRAAHIPDPTGAVWTLATALDGTRTRDQAIDAVRQAHPDLDPDTVEAGIDQFHDGGYLYDAAEPEPADFTRDELARYDRARQLFQWADRHPRTSQWDPQRALRRAVVTILGVGGAGGAAADALARSGVGAVHLIDPDTVEVSNLGRQTPYRSYDTGRPKVDSAVDHLEAINPHVTAVGRQARMKTQQHLERLLTNQHSDLLLLCADEPGLHIAVNRACLTTGQTWIDTGYHGLKISYALYEPGTGPCWWCVRLGDAERRQQPVTSREDLLKALPKVPGNPSSPVTAGMSGLWAAHLATAALTGAFPYQTGVLYSTNLLRLDADDMATVTRHPRRSDCPDCGTAAGPAPATITAVGSA